METPEHKKLLDEVRSQAQTDRAHYWRWKFAGQAMQAILSNESLRYADTHANTLCGDAVAVADELIKQLQKEPENNG